MTSGNKRDEPIAINENDLKNILGGIADAALVHDRRIIRRCDDSVLKLCGADPIMLRRSRGYVPGPIRLSVSGRPVLACGAELKNTICVTRGDQAFLSAHIGDLDDIRNYYFLRESARDFIKLLEIKPEIIAYDMHPDYLSSRYALSLGGVKHLPVQHHHAHIASCLAEHALPGKVIGIALDGTGFGTDGTIWGGELLIADLISSERVGHFKQYPLPGGQAAILNPARMALSILSDEFGAEAEKMIRKFLPMIKGQERKMLAEIINRKLHSPLTSSAGRLFDAVAALLGLGGEVSYEGRAAVRLQTMVDKTVTRNYSYEIHDKNGILVLSFSATVRAILADLGRGRAGGRIAAMFHNTIAAALAEACGMIRKREGLNRVALSGGVFQNDFLLERLTNCLEEKKFNVYTNRLVPPNDGGISLGQAAVAVAREEM
jgi:hydrogenase maturation protein HypF